MKKTIFLNLCLLIFASSFSQNYYMSQPEGFGSSTTGGGTVSPATVTTYNDLKAKIKSNTPQVILVSGIINFPSGGAISEVFKNKTIIGLPGAKLVNNNQTTGAGIIYLKNGSSNVIIRNLIFEGPGAYDIDGKDNLTADGCINLWVDHCEFQDGQDGNFDIKGNSDNVTVSWCKFTYLKAPKAGGSGGSSDHRYTNLIGSSKSQAPADGHYSVTFQNNYWGNGCKERMPRARNGELHILNCYYNTDVSSSTALGFGGGINNLTCYVEGTHFEKVKNVYKSYISSDGGTVDLIFDNCIKGVSNIGSVSKPSYSYSSFPASDVEAFVTNSTCGAGANLQVTSSGIMSSSCESLNVENYSLSSSIKHYPSVVKDEFTIEYFNTSGNVELKIYSIIGKQVYNLSKKISLGDKSIIKTSHLSKGIYICSLKIKNKSTSWKIIKN
jgi:pectate lyase